MTTPTKPTPRTTPQPAPPQPASPMHVPDEINELVKKAPTPGGDRQRTDI